MKRNNWVQVQIFSISQVDQTLDEATRSVMLDLVLVWASLDGAIGMMLSKAIGSSPLEGAELVDRIPTNERFRELQKALRLTPGGAAAATKIKKYKRQYERFSKIRDMIVHSHCAGRAKADPTWVVFLKFERVGDAEMACDAVDVAEFRRATIWGKELHALAMRVTASDYG